MKFTGNVPLRSTDNKDLPTIGYVQEQIDTQLWYVQESILGKPDITEVINTIYPVGSIYITLSSTFDPNTTWTGTTWTRLSEGVFLESSTTPNSEKQAGLPNITGYIENYDQTGRTALLTDYGLNCVGAFGWTQGTYYVVSTKVQTASNGSPQNNKITIDASRSSSVYGNSTTVQPHSLTVVMWQRTG